jgi:hypothetical protein
MVQSGFLCVLRGASFAAPVAHFPVKRFDRKAGKEVAKVPKKTEAQSETAPGAFFRSIDIASQRLYGPFFGPGASSPHFPMKSMA